MPNLSTPIGELRPRYDVVIIGSGYGGAVVARRMAEAAQERRARGEAPFSVCLLERGLEIRPGQYPTSLVGAVRAGQADTRYGHIGRRTSLFDVRMNRDLTVLVGCGLGGTSLINASVILEPQDFSDQRWPPELRSISPSRCASWSRRQRRLESVPRPVDLLGPTARNGLSGGSTIWM